jgi:hypothetical protein
MITPKEIEQQCQNWWKSVLTAYIDSVDFFPKEINRIGKITAKDLLERLPEYQKSLALLRNNSKINKKYGYTLVEIERQFDKIGKQLIPDKIVIETLDDYLKSIGKEKDYQVFVNNYNLIIQAFPELKDRLIKSPQKVIDNQGKWKDILKVCAYFNSNPKPNLYIRELPIKVHTKFIENNKPIIKELLDILIRKHINPDEKKFEKRFNLKYDEPLVRFRILDKNISQTYFSGIEDSSIPVSQFEKLELPIKRVFVVENKMNVLTFPVMRETIVLFGMGYGIEILKNVQWLNGIELFYWGDLDVQGFEILSQFKGYFPHTQSILMDMDTFEKYFEKDAGTPTKITATLNLTAEEQKLFELLKANNWRLEQEKIPQEFANRVITDNSKRYDVL